MSLLEVDDVVVQFGGGISTNAALATGAPHVTVAQSNPAVLAAFRDEPLRSFSGDVLSDPRVTAAVVGIGCPDYTRLMTDRARLSKLKSYTETTPPGSGFLGSQDFPQAWLDAIAKFDPAGLLLPEVRGVGAGASATSCEARERVWAMAVALFLART